VAITRNSASIWRQLSVNLSTCLTSGIRECIWRYISRTDPDLSRFDREIPINSWKQSIHKKWIAEKSLFRRNVSAGNAGFNFLCTRIFPAQEVLWDLLEIFTLELYCKPYFSGTCWLDLELPRLCQRSQYALNYWGHPETHRARSLANDSPSKGLQANFLWTMNY
jgi:hypothetical protein